MLYVRVCARSSKANGMTVTMKREILHFAYWIRSIQPFGSSILMRA